MKPKAQTNQTDQNASAAFTLMDLLIVLGVLALLALTVLPALGRSPTHSKSALCQHNLKQLAVAWQMYAEEYNGKIVANYHGAAGPGPGNWVSGWLDWGISTDNTNTLKLIAPTFASLATYLRGEANHFKCPADQHVSVVQRSRGWTHRVRSYSANIYIGEGNASSGPTYPIYKQIRKTSEFFYPPPAQAWVFVEEHPDSMNDPAFFGPGQTIWVDWPATYHNGGAALAFGDGHTEMRKWRGTLAAGPATRVTYVNSNNNNVPADDVDISWLSYRTPRVSTNSY